VFRMEFSQLEGFFGQHSFLNPLPGEAHILEKLKKHSWRPTDLAGSGFDAADDRMLQETKKPPSDFHRWRQSKEHEENLTCET
jgi:hypothetical protein